MIVQDLHVARASIPAEDDTPLIVDPNRVQAFQVAFQRFESVPWWDPQVCKLHGRIQILKLPLRDFPQGRRKSSRRRSLPVEEQVGGEAALERDNHVIVT
jgi:hypothetical protein